jgi:pyrroloquinoline quinone biosynthesis protein B
LDECAAAEGFGRRRRIRVRLSGIAAMFIKVLGSAAGGGLPQVNCNCDNCAAVRRGERGISARTQSSLAVSADGKVWALLNASPDLRQQVAATPELAPDAANGPRASPIKAVVLTNGDLDHIAGLLSLREGIHFTICASKEVLAALEANSVFNALDRAVVGRSVLAAGGAMQLRNGDDELGLELEAFPVPGKVALYLEDAAAGPGFGTREGDTLGLRISEPKSGAAFFYIPGCATVDAPLAARLEGASLVLFDGTLFTDDEMIAQGLSSKSGRRMGHISMSGNDGSLAAFANLNIKRKVYTHINNSNPALREGSSERRTVEAAGWEIASDGMEFRL